MIETEYKANYITVLTSDKSFEKELLKLVKKEPWISINKTEDSKLVIVCNDTTIDSFDKDLFYIKLMTKNSNKEEGYNSYIYCEDDKVAVIDLIKALDCNLISIDADDLKKITNNKSLDLIRFEIKDLEDTKSLIEKSNINVINKNCLVMIYGNMNLSLATVDEIIHSFKFNIDFYYVAILDEALKDNEIVLSLLIEQ